MVTHRGPRSEVGADAARAGRAFCFSPGSASFPTRGQGRWPGGWEGCSWFSSFYTVRWQWGLPCCHPIKCLLLNELGGLSVCRQVPGAPYPQCDGKKGGRCCRGVCCRLWGSGAGRRGSSPGSRKLCSLSDRLFLHLQDGNDPPTHTHTQVVTRIK